MATSSGFIPYEQVRKEFAAHPLRSAEIPVGHHVSTPLPTLRWSVPAYAVFACPAARTPGRPLWLDAPDRWWAISAETGRLVGYALTRALPYAAGPLGEPVTVSPTGRPLAAAKEDLRMLGELLQEAAPGFFRGEPVAAELRTDLGATLTAVLPAEARPWYRALTPDFFAWLEEDGDA